MSEACEPPRFTSVRLYNSPDGLLSFWYPPEWQMEVCEEPTRTVTLTPDPADPATSLVIELHDLEAPLLRRERRLILEGVKEGLAQLDDCVIERLEALDQTGRWGVEWECTFQVGDERRKRRARLYFSDRYQYAITCQGSTEERYTYWQGMLEWVLLTVATSAFNLLEQAGSQEPEPES